MEHKTLEEICEENNVDTLEVLEQMIENYRTNKQIRGEGLQDDPEWVTKIEAEINS